ncbi:MAG: hypothetical protein EPN70_05790 [Paraburkholderia sp.]|uniref:hypothetical protein n=1 Tax=Paraburkholderia sp. TaxID=1926495 RepID=UPI00122AAD5E|nr:hypothetical protein [Paraburkholderia sp.]TAM06436.1 MAG: hypothetical protein EPN70_05790 [Paraburkholderia sp.]TAM29380.1 MAG: hypothetical protein EPN59_12945 [Paraburkholderia sp.]
MNLHDQIGALEAAVDQLLVAATPHAACTAEAANADHPVADATADVTDTAAAAEAQPEVTAAEPAAAESAAAESTGPTLNLARPSQNAITMTIGDQTVTLHPLQVGQMIEELSNARASMEPEVPPGIPGGWRFVSTKNPVMAVQKQPNGDRLLVLRHTGHGWVPFTFSPETVIEMYMLLTQR